MHFTCRSFLGHSSPTSWSQFWENEPDDNQQSGYRGHLFGLVNLQFATPPTDLPLVGRQIIDSLTKAYFAATQPKISDRLRATIPAVISNPAYSQVSIKLSLAVIKDNQLFLATWGSVSASVCRSGQVATILQGQNSLCLLTQGILHPRDRLFWATTDFIDQLNWEDIKSYLADPNIQSLEENLLPRLYSSDQQAGQAAVAIDIHQSDSDISPPSPTLAPLSLPFSPPAPISSPPPHSLPPPRRPFKIPHFRLPQFHLPKFRPKPVSVNSHRSTNLNHHRRINLIVAALLLIALIASTFIGYKKNQSLRTEALFQSLRQEVEKKLADATAIKNLNLDSAQDLARQSQKILSQMQSLKIHPTDLVTYQDQVALLLSQTGSLPSSTPASFYDLSLIANETGYSRLAIANQIIYLLDPIAGRIDSLSITERSNKSISTTDSLKSATDILINGQQIFAQVNNDLLLSSKTQTDKKVTFPNPVSQANFYNGALYYLDSTSLWKVNPNSTDFGTPKKWLKDDQSVPPQATSLAINGQLWILSSDGLITPFNLGQKVNFKMSQSPKITGAHSLTVSLASDQLAFADDANNVYVVHKDGNVSARYNYSSQKVLDLAISDADHSLFVLTADQNIYKIVL